MKTESTNVLGLITGKIKNNPTIYASKTSFTIFLNGELIVRGVPDAPCCELHTFEKAKEVLEKLKYGNFEVEEYQNKFDQFIRK